MSEYPDEEEEVPLKRKRVASLDKDNQVQTQALVSCKDAAGEGLFQLPKVWSESGRFGSQASLYLSDLELRAIRDLGLSTGPKQ